MENGLCGRVGGSTGSNPRDARSGQVEDGVAAVLRIVAVTLCFAVLGLERFAVLRGGLDAGETMDGESLTGREALLVTDIEGEESITLIAGLIGALVRDLVTVLEVKVTGADSMFDLLGVVEEGGFEGATSLVAARGVLLVYLVRAILFCEMI